MESHLIKQLIQILGSDKAHYCTFEHNNAIKGLKNFLSKILVISSTFYVIEDHDIWESRSWFLLLTTLNNFTSLLGTHLIFNHWLNVLFASLR